MIRLTNYALNGEYEKAQKIHYDYFDLFEALRFESNPMAVKMALNLMNLPAGFHRSPLTPLSEGKTNILKQLMKLKGLL